MPIDLLLIRHLTIPYNPPSFCNIAWLNDNEGKKIIVFAHHQSVLNKIEDAIKAIKRIRIDGSTNPKVRDV